MANDALDPGPLGDFPYLPRNPDGTLDTTRFSVGIEHRTNPITGELMKLRILPHVADGRPVTDIAPLPAGQSVDDILPRQ